MSERPIHVNHEKKKTENKSFHCIQCQCSIFNIVNEGEGHGFQHMKKKLSIYLHAINLKKAHGI